MNFKTDKSLIIEAQRHSEERLKFEYNRFGLSNDKRRFYGDDYKVPLRSLLSIKKLINNDK